MPWIFLRVSSFKKRQRPQKYVPRSLMVTTLSRLQRLIKATGIFVNTSAGISKRFNVSGVQLWGTYLFALGKKHVN
jgi:hypothetical protein